LQSLDLILNPRKEDTEKLFGRIYVTDVSERIRIYVQKNKSIPVHARAMK
jgi:hypothetical protein